MGEAPPPPEEEPREGRCLDDVARSCAPDDGDSRLGAHCCTKAFGRKTRAPLETVERNRCADATIDALYISRIITGKLRPMSDW